VKSSRRKLSTALISLTCRRGGDLGSFGPGQMVKEFDTVVFSANLNEVQGPVQTQFGYHLLEVTSRTD
jgi:peptidyl-prolyl cis-trans isomerase C